MKTRLPVVSTYLENLWNRVLAEKGWTAKQLAEASGVSYGYVRRIVNGTLIPSKDALRRMCTSTGQDLGVVWTGIHSHDGVLVSQTIPRVASFLNDKNMPQDLRTRMEDCFRTGISLLAKELTGDDLLALYSEATRLHDKRNENQQS